MHEESEKYSMILNKNDCFGYFGFFTGKENICKALTTKLTTIITISRIELINIIKGNRREYDKFQEIKDQIELNNNFQDLKISCQGCLQFHHETINCPFMHYEKDTLFLCTSKNNRQVQERSKRININYNLKRNNSFNTLNMQINVHEKASRFAIDYGFLNILEDINNCEDDDDDDDEDEDDVDNYRNSFLQQNLNFDSFVPPQQQTTEYIPRIPSPHNQMNYSSKISRLKSHQEDITSNNNNNNNDLMIKKAESQTSMKDYKSDKIDDTRTGTQNQQQPSENKKDKTSCYKNQQVNEDEEDQSQQLQQQQPQLQQQPSQNQQQQQQLPNQTQVSIMDYYPSSIVDVDQIEQEKIKQVIQNKPHHNNNNNNNNQNKRCSIDFDIQQLNRSQKNIQDNCSKNELVARNLCHGLYDTILQLLNREQTNLSSYKKISRSQGIIKLKSIKPTQPKHSNLENKLANSIQLNSMEEVIIRRNLNNQNSLNSQIKQQQQQQSRGSILKLNQQEIQSQQIMKKQKLAHQINNIDDNDNNQKEEIFLFDMDQVFTFENYFPLNNINEVLKQLKLYQTQFAHAKDKLKILKKSRNNLLLNRKKTASYCQNSARQKSSYLN